MVRPSRLFQAVTYILLLRAQVARTVLCFNPPQYYLRNDPDCGHLLHQTHVCRTANDADAAASAGYMDDNSSAAPMDIGRLELQRACGYQKYSSTA